MLNTLYISNYALIEETKITFGRDLNILTGETGAGKSLLLGAIGLILGKRLDFGIIFNPDKKCVVEATFRHIPPAIAARLKKIEAFDWDDDALVIRREASTSGKSRAFVNDTPVSLQVLKALSSQLVDLHGQHQNQALLSPEYQLQLLDQFAVTSQEAIEFGEMLAETQKVRKQITQFEKEEAEAKKQEDYFRFLLDELQSADLKPDEETQLEEELQTLEHAEEIKEHLSFAAANLFDEETSAYNQLSDVLQRLQKVSNLNSSISQQAQSLDEARIILQEAVREIEHINDDIDLDPGRLSEMQERYDFLNRLMKKYVVKTASELIEKRDEYAAKIGRFDSLGDDISELKKGLAIREAELLKAGLALEKKRIKKAALLDKDVDQLLVQVGLENAKFEVAVERIIEPNGYLEIDGQKILPDATGINQIDFRIRTNKGMPIGSLGQIASGGEISRVMLAIKAALAEKAALSVLIFDEIDTGISGETANKVGRVMALLAERYQLIAITHLPQIAARAGNHFHIYKEIESETTISRVSPLDENGRIMEIAYMLSGAKPSDSAIQNAKELITSGRN